MIARLNVGGPAYHVSLLSGMLEAEQYETLLVSGHVGKGEASMEEVADAYGVQRQTVRSLGPELDLLADARALHRLTRIARGFQPHIVHTHTAKAGFLGRLAALAVRPRPRIVHTYHGHVLDGYFGPWRTATYRLLETGMARVSDRLVGVSSATVDDLVSLRIAPPEKFKVVPLGLDLGPFLSLRGEAGSQFRLAVGARTGDALLLYIGRLVPIKRLDIILHALARAHRLGAPIRLAVVGDGPTRPDLERLADELGIRSVVTFTGYRRDLPELVGAADIGVLSSDNEGTPVSLIEMAAGGRPLIATAVGGVRDVVADGCGVVVPKGDAFAMGNAMAWLATDSGARQQMGRMARSHVRERFSSERLIADVASLYRELLD